jgi:ADP-ribosylglycohydrolase
MDATPSARMAQSLAGLAVGDAFGERFFDPEVLRTDLLARTPPPGRWAYTDDTEMALALVEVLGARGEADPDALAAAFARRYRARPWRGYGPTAARILEAIADGEPWARVSRAVFGGTGSRGNGAAMRVAPLGAFFADDLDRVALEAVASALPTHAHPEGQAGAVAVAVAAAVAARLGAGDGHQLLATTVAFTPPGVVRDGLELALDLGFNLAGHEAAERLGSGQEILATDTVPFALWCAARHLDDFEAALWTTVSGLGDRDTTCAIAGGVVALSAPGGIPEAWQAATEPWDQARAPAAPRPER